MKKNVGLLDRFFRFSVGFLSLGIAFATGDMILRVVLGLVALTGILTAILGYCPINAKLGMDTTGKKEF